MVNRADILPRICVAALTQEPQEKARFQQTLALRDHEIRLSILTTTTTTTSFLLPITIIIAVMYRSLLTWSKAGKM